MKEKIEQIILDYQNAITEYFDMEVPMDDLLENMKAEILELFE